MSKNGKNGGGFVLIEGQGGYSVIPSASPLTRLNYYDGKFLRADDLRVEQQGIRELVHLSNHAQGSGVVYGLDCKRAGDALTVRPGLAVGKEGRLLRLDQEITVSIQELIAAAKGENAAKTSSSGGASAFSDCELVAGEPPSAVTDAGELWIVTISHAEAKCGEDAVFGNLCEDACVTDVDRAYIKEGIVLRAEAYALKTPLIESTEVTLGSGHRRSRVATAYFADEAAKVPHAITGSLLKSELWCRGAEPPVHPCTAGIPLVLVAMNGSIVHFDDMWTVRRERMGDPPRAYWAWRMRMRPWNVFLAQVLQFQCQLRSIGVVTATPGGEGDPCAPAYAALGSVKSFLQQMKKSPFLVDLPDVTNKFQQIEDEIAGVKAGSQTGAAHGILIGGGIVTVPSAGYLPVVPDGDVTVEEQVRRYFGDGVDLRFCVARADLVAHALEEAQHLERVSLVHGLDHPDDKQQVDVIVPDGEIGATTTNEKVAGYDMEVTTALKQIVAILASPKSSASVEGKALVSPALAFRDVSAFRYQGVGHGDATGAGGSRFHFAGVRVSTFSTNAASSTKDSEALWLSMSIEKDAFVLPVASVVKVQFEALVGLAGDLSVVGIAVSFLGGLKILAPATVAAGATQLKTRLSGTVTIESGGQSISIPVDESVSLARTSAGRTEVLIKGVKHWANVLPNTVLDAHRAWTSAVDAEVEAVLSIAVVGAAAATKTSVPLAQSKQHLDAAVANASHPAHVRAIQAIESIDATIGKPGFADLATGLLFPPAASTSTSFAVKATRDWVFFHRRRERSCGGQAPVVIAEPARYRVLHVRVDDKSSLPLLKQALSGGSTLGLFDFDAVTSVEFGPGVQSIVSSTDALKSAFALAAGSSAEIAYLAIGVRSDADDPGDVLSAARLDAVGDLLDDVVARNPGAASEVLTAAPSALDPQTGEGIVVVATAKVATVCHEVWRYVADEGGMNKLFSALDQIGAKEAFAKLELVSIGKAQFKAGTTELIGADAQIRQNWLAANDGAVSQIVLLVDPNAGSMAAPAQSLLLAKKATAGSIDAGAPDPRPANLDGMCPAVTVLVVPPELKLECHDVWAIAQEAQHLPTIVKLFSTDDAATRFEAAAKEGFLVLLGKFSFTEGTAAATETSMAKIVAKTQDFLLSVPHQNSRLRVVSFSPKGTTGAAAALHVERSDVLREALKAIKPTEAATFGATPFPSECPAFGLLVLERGSIEPVSLSHIAFMVEDEVVNDFAIHYTRDDEVIRDELFDNAVAALKEKGVQFDALEFTKATATGGGPPDARHVALAKVLEAEGLLTTDADLKKRKLRAAELASLNERLPHATEAFVLKGT